MAVRRGQFYCVILKTILLITLYSRECNGITKRYVSSWDLSNEMNWKDGVFPCPSRRITFEEKQDFPIFLNKKLSLGAIDFPFDTDFIFGNESYLEFSSTIDSSCKGSQSVSVFENKAKGYWWDPDSWQCEDDKKYECSSAVPDVHHVPCTADTVIIPNANDSLYRIIFTDPMPTVASLVLGVKNMTTSEFFIFTSSNEGQRRVLQKTLTTNRRNSLYIESEGSCSDITGCQCHASNPTEEICRHMSLKCPIPSCSNPVKMTGFCCPTCGSEISISHNGSLNLNLLRDILKRVLEMPEGNEVDGYSAKMSDGLIHVYFLPKETWNDYENAASVFIQLFARELNANGKHTVQSLVAKGSIAEQLEDKKRSNSRLTAGLVTFVIILLIAIFASYIFRKRRTNDLPFMFRRMSFSRMSMRSRSSSILPQTSHVAAFSTSTGRSFINPSFNDPEAVQLPNLPVIPAVETPNQRENPLYAVHTESGISFNALKDANKTFEMQTDGEETLGQKEEENNDILINLESVLQTDEDNKTGDYDDEAEDPLEILARSRIESVKEIQKANTNSVKCGEDIKSINSEENIKLVEEIRLNDEDLKTPEEKKEVTDKP